MCNASKIVLTRQTMLWLFCCCRFFSPFFFFRRLDVWNLCGAFHQLQHIFTLTNLIEINNSSHSLSLSLVCFFFSLLLTLFCLLYTESYHIHTQIHIYTSIKYTRLSRISFSHFQFEKLENSQHKFEYHIICFCRYLLLLLCVK